MNEQKHEGVNIYIVNTSLTRLYPLYHINIVHLYFVILWFCSYFIHKSIFNLYLCNNNIYEQLIITSIMSLHI